MKYPFSSLELDRVLAQNKEIKSNYPYALELNVSDNLRAVVVWLLEYEYDCMIGITLRFTGNRHLVFWESPQAYNEKRYQQTQETTIYFRFKSKNHAALFKLSFYEG